MLTKAQALTLSWLETRPQPARADNPMLRRKIGMMRRLEERGLARRNIHGRWFVTAAGRAALAQSQT